MLKTKLPREGTDWLELKETEELPGTQDQLVFPDVPERKEIEETTASLV